MALQNPANLGVSVEFYDEEGPRERRLHSMQKRDRVPGRRRHC